MNKEPLVSVLIPSYNSAKYLDDSIDSILNQTYTNWELIISDDCSTDDSFEIAQRYASEDKRIKAFKNERNLGISGNMNKALEECSGKYIAILDADDWSYSYRLKEQVDAMENNNKIVACSGWFDICDEELKVKYTKDLPESNEELRKAMKRYMPLIHPGTMWRNEALFKTDLYPEYLNVGHDYLITIDISEHGELYNLQKPVIKYRVREKSITGEKLFDTELVTGYLQLYAHFKYDDYKLSKKEVFFITIRFLITVIFPAKFVRFLANYSTIIHRVLTK
ncbi:MAG: Glycosyltransferase [candidate division WS6 bacterium 34_10]|uniref:Glycosyltransferase n=1 Tax=candidate division WS6 bacterium 34_10 TaxID=1641389 RepID=A0A101HI74_9BACT|nr:MAG: Glycosyltransferase [candidate division WS6 bacterium 34_10]